LRRSVEDNEAIKRHDRADGCCLGIVDRINQRSKESPTTRFIALPGLELPRRMGELLHVKWFEKVGVA